MSDMKSKLANRRAQQQASEPKPTFNHAQESAEQTKRTSYDLPISVHRRLKLAAVEHDRTQVSILIEALEAWHKNQQ